jgi:hypothetical protein
MKVSNIKNILVGRSETVASLKGDLETLNAEGAGLIADVETHERVIETAEAEGEILTAMGKVKAARNRLAKLDKKIAETRERLAVAQMPSAPRAGRAAEELFPGRAGFPYCGHGLPGSGGPSDRRAGCTGRCRVSHPTDPPAPIPSVGPAPLLALDLLNMFQEGWTSPRTVPNPRRNPPRRASRPSSARRQRAALREQRRPPNGGWRRANFTTKISAMARLMVMLRAGVEYGRDDLGRSMAGDVVSVDAATAKNWLLSGAADFHKPDDLFPAPREEVAAAVPADDA